MYIDFDHAQIILLIQLIMSIDSEHTQIAYLIQTWHVYWFCTYTYHLFYANMVCLLIDSEHTRLKLTIYIDSLCVELIFRLKYWFIEDPMGAFIKFCCYILDSEPYIIITLDSEAMENPSAAPFRGILRDVRGRLPCYKQDWVQGLNAGIRSYYEFFRFSFFKRLYMWWSCWIISLQGF